MTVVNEMLDYVAFALDIIVPWYWSDIAVYVYTILFICTTDSSLFSYCCFLLPYNNILLTCGLLWPWNP